MADTDANRAHLVAVDESGAIGVGRQGVQVGPLGQIVRVAQAVDVHGVQVLVRISTLPRREDVAGAADRRAHADHVRIDAQAVPREAAIGEALAHGGATGLLAAAHQREVLAGEHAVFRTAIGQRQLDHFEVVGAADDELLRGPLS
ncbi:hypothetical protein G6F57_021362 [Rhizopus arrhizus]|nr:hypothetical protein G6F57_021362 [Rhizopus arrhizus]